MFVRVDHKQAGTTALGVLVPPGAKTLVIARPKALAWDLLPARWDGDGTHAPEFCEFTRDDAAPVARQLMKDLEGAAAAGVNPVQTFGDAAGTCVQIWVHTPEYVWIVCRRTPGKAYRPMIFQSQDAARREAEAIAAVVWPAADRKQEYYFNTQNFS